jgi:hypothetical protein
MLTERGGGDGRATGRGACAPIEVSGREREPGMLVIGSNGASRDAVGAALIGIRSMRALALAATPRGIG